MLANNVESIWEILETIPDPEIPVISVVELGVIRKVELFGNETLITITPTYSGCPATSVINFDIEKALREHGVEKVVLKRQLSPPWTTTSPRGRTGRQRPRPRA